MTALCDSLRSRGQQVAIEVADLGAGRDGGRWGLISGWRRLVALRRLHAAEAGTDRVLAVVRPRADEAEAYRAMVEENEIRVGLSFYERARIVARAADRGVFRSDRAALAALFAAAPRARRSKIGSFVRIVRALDAELRYPSALTERLGLRLAAALEAEAGLAGRLADALRAAPPADAGAEARSLARLIGPAGQKAASPAPAAAPEPAPAPKAGPERVDLGDRLSCQMGGEVIALSGPAARDPGFRRDLVAWLKSQGLRRTPPTVAVGAEGRDRPWVGASRRLWSSLHGAAPNSAKRRETVTVRPPGERGGRGPGPVAPGSRVERARFAFGRSAAGIRGNRPETV